MRNAVAVAIACFSVWGISNAGDAGATMRQSTHIAAQGLGPALESLAKERDFQVLYRTEIVGERRTVGASGDLTLEEALEQLLVGTGLTYRRLDERTVTIVPVLKGGEARASFFPSALSSMEDGQGRHLQVAAGEVPSSLQSEGMSEDEKASQAPSDSSEAERSKIQEIVVTAQKRQEYLEKVPIAISVLSGEALDRSRVQGVTEALNRVPGVATVPILQGGGYSISVRGVAPSAFTFASGSPTAYYVDSVPFGLVKTAIAPDASPYDLERIEVLKGPQGTLYGANSVAGVVRILTTDADLDEFDLKGRTSWSTLSEGSEGYRGDMAVNVPIVEGKLAARMVAGYDHESGWIDKPLEKNANDSDLANIRLKLNAQPTEALSLGASVWRSRNDYGMPNRSNLLDRHPSRPIEEISTDFDVYGFKAGYEFSIFSLASTTSYMKYRSAGAQDFAGVSNFTTALGSDIFTEEVVLNAKTDGLWVWSVGGFYRDAEDSLYQHIPGVIPAPADFSDTSESFAFFGQLTRKLFNDRLEITGGLRYFEDEVGQQENVANTGNPNQTLLKTRDKFDALTPRAVLTWYPQERLTIYASYAQGFRSGFNQNPLVLPRFPNLPPVRPDRLHNFELGIKGSTSGGRLRYESAIYYLRWKDIQQNLRVPYDNTGQFAAAAVNGSSASGPGFEFSLNMQPLARLELGANFSYSGITNDSDVFSGTTLLFYKDQRLNTSPKYTAGLSADYSFPLGGAGFEGRLSAAANYISRNQVTILNGTDRAVFSGDNLPIARASFTLIAPQNFAATLFVENLNNERGIVLNSADQNGLTITTPRKIGIQLEYHFQ